MTTTPDSGASGDSNPAPPLAALPALLAEERDDGSPAAPHAWKEHHGLKLAFVTSEPVDALLRVRAVAEQHGVRFSMRCFEALSEDGDPLAQLR